jgi:hypothetical protein
MIVRTAWTSAFSLVVFGLSGCGLSTSPQEEAASVQVAQEANSKYWLQTREAGTVLKRLPMESAKVSAADTCDLAGDVKLDLAAPAIILSNANNLVRFAETPKGCDFAWGYIASEHIAASSENRIKENTDGGYSLTILKPTWLKRGTAPEKSLRVAEQKCTLHWNETVGLQGNPIYAGEGHWVINLARKIPGCEFSMGIVKRDDVKINIGFGEPFWIQTGDKVTVLKRIAREADSLPPDQVCDLQPGTIIDLTGPAVELSNGHLLVNSKDFTPGCSFSSGFIFRGHVKTISAVKHSENTDGGYSFVVKKDTWLRRGTGKHETLKLKTEKCTLHAGERIKLQGAPHIFEGNMYVANLEKRIPGCEFSLGLVSKDDVDLQNPVNQASQGAPSDYGRRLARASLNVAAAMPGSGYCYAGVARAIVASVGVDVWSMHGIPGNSAYQFGRWANANPATLASSLRLARANINVHAAPIGSVFVYEPRFAGAHPVHGHIEIKVSAFQACSDYCGSVYRQPSYIYVPL